MIKVTWDKFYPYVRPLVQNCPLSYVDAAIRAAAIEFCDKSLIWNEPAICGDMYAGERVYKYNFHSDGFSIIMPISVILREFVTSSNNNNLIEVIDHHVNNVNLQDLDTYHKNWRLVEAEWPTHFYMKDRNTFVFVERPTQDKYGAIHTLCAVKPTRDSIDVPEWLFEDWADTIAAGALARLLGMPSRVWGNLSMVPYYTSQFRAGISRAKSKMYKSHTTQSKRMLPKAF